MRSLNAAEPQFSGDDGAADPAVSAALAAYAAGRGSEHAALNALASSRLLVPVVAVLTEEASGDYEATGDSETGDSAVPDTGLRREKSTEMALPTLIGRDGRAAVLAFTSLAALTRWRPDARPVAVPAARAWQAGAEEASAVVIDVAGPVPVTVEGARLAALAAGRPAPLPHQDPDVLAALHAALGHEQLIAQASLTTPDQRAGWEYGPRPEDLPDLAARSAADLGALGLDLNGTSPGRAGGDTAAGASAAGAGAAADDAAGTSAGRDGAAAGDAGAGSAGMGLESAGDGVAGLDAAAPETAGPDPVTSGTAARNGAAEDTADLALQVTLADGCDPAAATAAVRRVAEALLTATGGRLRRGMEISVAAPRAGRGR
ncbi:MAG TPA: SseB family protein [Streptosporangiaceae bacterium]